MRKFGILIAALTVLRLAAPVFAHHGFDHRSHGPLSEAAQVLMEYLLFW